MNTTAFTDPMMAQLIIEHRLNKEFCTGPQIAEAIIREAGSKVADHIIAHHLPEILEKISPDAIANMAIAEAGAAVNRTIKEKLPDKIVEVVRREKPHVYQNGLLGGLKRIS